MGLIGCALVGAGAPGVWPTSDAGEELRVVALAPVTVPLGPYRVAEGDGAQMLSGRLVDVDAAVAAAKARKKAPLPDVESMSPEQLQAYAVRVQGEFVEASLAYETAKTQAVQADEAASVASAAAVRAEIEADSKRAAFASGVAGTYQSGLMTSPMVQVLSGGPDSVEEFVTEYTATQTGHEVGSAVVAEFKDASQRADEASAQAAELKAAAQASEEKAEVLLDDVQGRAAKVSAAAARALMENADGQSMFASAEQRARNAAALRQWRAYLRTLEQARVVPPSAEVLRAPGRLPAGLRPWVDAVGRTVPGVAAKTWQGRIVAVLPAETISAVSRAFAVMGKPYAPSTAGPGSFDCAGLVTASWPSLDGPVSPATLASRIRRVPVASMQVGDVVFFTRGSDGVQHAGLNLGGGLMLTADAISQQVGVQEFPGKPWAAGRVSLKAASSSVPRSPVDSQLRCGGVEQAGSQMVYPLRAGTFRLSAGFGKAGPLWSSGYHTGQDFGAPVGTPVMAAKGGRVTVSQVSWAGPNFVEIDHGDGLGSSYAHMASATVTSGQVVQAGQVIGTVGSMGNSTGPHLHFEVTVGGVQVDPMLFLDGPATGGSSAGGWGGFANGLIPAQALCGLPGASAAHLLRCDAAAAWASMAKAYQADLRQPLCITDSYRSYEAQVRLYAEKPGLAAVPGTSNHGWALAVDLCGGIERFGTPQHAWMVRNAGRFGWVHPSWAQAGGSKPEPWHWEFGRL